MLKAAFGEQKTLSTCLLEQCSKSNMMSLLAKMLNASYVHQKQTHEYVDKVKEFVLEKRKNH